MNKSQCMCYSIRVEETVCYSSCYCGQQPILGVQWYHLRQLGGGLCKLDQPRASNGQFVELVREFVPQSLLLSVVSGAVRKLPPASNAESNQVD